MCLKPFNCLTWCQIKAFSSLPMLLSQIEKNPYVSYIAVNRHNWKLHARCKIRGAQWLKQLSYLIWYFVVVLRYQHFERVTKLWLWLLFTKPTTHLSEFGKSIDLNKSLASTLNIYSHSDLAIISFIHLITTLRKSSLQHRELLNMSLLSTDLVLSSLIENPKFDAWPW